MLCPVCKKETVPKNLKGKSMEMCTSCEGMWAQAPDMEELFHLKVNKGRVITCGRCKIPMYKENAGGVEVDLCHKCGLIWLDKDELTKIWFTYRPK